MARKPKPLKTYIQRRITVRGETVKVTDRVVKEKSDGE